MLFLPFDRRINDRVPWAVFLLVAINVAITIHSYFGFDEERVAAIFQDWGANATRLQTHAWVTHMFLHAGPVHVVGNMLFLVLFGMNVERRLGPAVTLALYFFSGFAALALFILFNRGFDAPLVGASGAVSGVMGMYLVLFRRRTVEVLWFAVVVGGIVRVRAAAVATLWIGLELLHAILLNEKVVVAHWAHVGGFAGGAGLTVVLVQVFRGYPEVYEPEGETPRPPETYDEKAYIPEAPAPNRVNGLSVVAKEWRPMSGFIRRIVDGVAPGSGAFSKPSQLAGGLAPPQAEDLRLRLDRAGYPTVVLPVSKTEEDPAVVFLDRLDIAPEGLAARDQVGTLHRIEKIARIQAGTARSVPIVDVVAGLRYRLSGATASMPVADAVAALRKAYAVEEADRPFESLEELDEYFRWRVQRAG